MVGFEGVPGGEVIASLAQLAAHFALRLGRRARGLEQGLKSREDHVNVPGVTIRYGNALPNRGLARLLAHVCDQLG